MQILKEIGLLQSYDVTFGEWIVRAETASKFANFKFEVSPSKKEGQSVRVTDIISSSIGKLVTIEGFVTGEQRVKITIEDPHGNTVFQTNVRTTENGEFDLLWMVSSEYVPGTYSVIVEDSFEKTASTIFDLQIQESIPVPEIETDKYLI